MMQLEARVIDVWSLVDIVNTADIEKRGTTLDAVNLIYFFQ